MNKLNFERIEERASSEHGELPLLLDEREAARLIGVSVSFLRKSRSEGTLGNRTAAPPFTCLGKRRLYRSTDLREWVDSLETQTAI
jgi:hypothetical protein